MPTDPMESAGEATTSDIEPLAVEQIVAQLDDVDDAGPYAAVWSARQRRDAVIPRLIAVLQEAAAQGRAGQVREGSAPWCSLFLLAEFRATEALPAVLELVSLPGELPLELLGDILHEDLPRILIALGVDVATLSAMIDNRDLNEYVRWKAIGTVVELVFAGPLSRAEAVERLRGHLRKAIDEEDCDVVSFLICDLCDLGPAEAQAEIKEAFDRDLVDLSLIDWECVEGDLAAGEEEMRARWQGRNPARISDAIKEIESWLPGGDWSTLR